MHIANSADGRKNLYDIDSIKKVEGPIKSGPTTTGPIVSQTSQNVKGAATHDNRLTETEKLTVVGGIGQESISNQGGKSPAVSSNCIIDTFQGFVNTQYSLAPIGKDRQTKQTPSSEEVQFTEATPIAPVWKENGADFEYSRQNLDNYAKELFGQKYADAQAKGDFAARNRMYAEALEDLATELGIDHDSRAEYVKKNGSSEEFADVNYSVYLDNLIRKNTPAASGQKNTTAQDSGGYTQFSLVGKNKDGIEVYETSKDTMNLTWDQRKRKYLDLMKNDYRGRTAKFERNGHSYYATFDHRSIKKHIYGDSRSDKNGVKALIKAGADGDVFDLVQNSEYTGSAKNRKNHTNADYFDYFLKTVQIDGKVFDLVADVEKDVGADGGYVYTLALVENKQIKASPATSQPKKVPVQSASNAFNGIVPQTSQNVNGPNSIGSTPIIVMDWGKRDEV